MHSLPHELFEAVLEFLAVYNFPESARFPVLDDASRQAILNTRLVARCFRDAKPLEKLFIAVLEETPFLWNGFQMPKLRAVARSKYAARMTTLSLCGTNLGPRIPRLGLEDEWTPGNIVSVLKSFKQIRDLRYYPWSPEYSRRAYSHLDSKCNTTAPVRRGYPPDDDKLWTWLRAEPSASWVCRSMMIDVTKANLPLDSVAFPLFGNRASYCGIASFAIYLPLTLKRLSISLTDRHNDNPLFEPWLKGMRQLTFLEVAISRNPDSLAPWNAFASTRKLTTENEKTPYDQLPRLEEFRLMSDNQYCFSENDLLLGLDIFPNLKRLGLAHILIKSQLNNAASWRSFIRRLVPKGLERLWLLEPRDLWTDGYMGQAGHYKMKKYFDLDGDFRSVARDVQLIDKNSLWVEEQEPPKRRDFDYPGFAVFEKEPAEERL